MNILRRQEIDSIWLPLITYANTDQKEATRLGMDFEWSTLVNVHRKGKMTRGGVDFVDEVEEYQGSKQRGLTSRNIYMAPHLKI